MLISMEEVGIKTVTASVVFASGCPIRRRTRSCWSRNSRRRRRRRRNGSRTIRFYTAAVAERIITVATAAGRRVTEMMRLLDVVI